MFLQFIYITDSPDFIENRACYCFLAFWLRSTIDWSNISSLKIILIIVHWHYLKYAFIKMIIINGYNNFEKNGNYLIPWVKSCNTDKVLQVICKMEPAIEKILVILQRFIDILVIACDSLFQKTNSFNITWYHLLANTDGQQYSTKMLVH